jgi:sigma-B regulation protein RsbU (phosphoserine phosphatase)
VAELGRVFDLSTPIGDRLLGEAVEQRLRSLVPAGAPDWGSEGSLTQLAKKESSALDFYYRPHLFPNMDPALRLGHHLQFDLLPRRLPQESPLRIAALLESYCHLSGDFLGWRLEDDELFLWVADVSGHGVRAGLAAATLDFLINGVEHGLPPAVFAQRVNESMLEARNAEDAQALFATAIWLRAGPDGRVLYASSGHNPQLLWRASGEAEYLRATGKPLGLLPRQTFDERSFRLEQDDAVCLFTDGLVEAPSPSGEEFGTARLAELPRRRGDSPMDLARVIYRAVRKHQATNLLQDDLTFVLVDLAANGD